MNTRNARRTTALTTAALALTGCSALSTASQDTAVSSSPAQSCTAQVTAWRDAGGSDLVSALGDGLASGADAVAEYTTAADAGLGTTTAVASLQQASSNITTAAADLTLRPPPSCAAGLNTDMTAALAGARTAAKDLLTADNGRKVAAAEAAVQAGQRQLGKVLTDLSGAGT